MAKQKQKQKQQQQKQKQKKQLSKAKHWKVKRCNIGGTCILDWPQHEGQEREEERMQAAGLTMAEWNRWDIICLL